MKKLENANKLELRVFRTFELRISNLIKLGNFLYQPTSQNKLSVTLLFPGSLKIYQEGGYYEDGSVLKYLLPKFTQFFFHLCILAVVSPCRQQVEGQSNESGEKHQKGF